MNNNELLRILDTLNISIDKFDVCDIFRWEFEWNAGSSIQTTGPYNTPFNNFDIDEYYEIYFYVLKMIENIYEDTDEIMPEYNVRNTSLFRHSDKQHPTPHLFILDNFYLDDTYTKLCQKEEYLYSKVFEDKFGKTLCGFKTLKSMNNWFNEVEQKVMHSLGFKLVKYKIKNIPNFVLDLDDGITPGSQILFSSATIIDKEIIDWNIISKKYKYENPWKV